MLDGTRVMVGHRSSPTPMGHMAWRTLPQWPHNLWQSFLASQCTRVTPHDHNCGHQAASATCVSSCAPGTLQWPRSKLSAPLSSVWPVTVTSRLSPRGPTGLCHPMPTAQGPSRPLPRIPLRGSARRPQLCEPCRFPTVPWFFPMPVEVCTACSVLPWEQWGAQQTLWPPCRGQLGAWRQLLVQRGTAPASTRLMYPHTRWCSTGDP